MFLIDALQEILFTVKQNKLRSFLTAFGVFWGIFLLILLLGAGQGLKNGMSSGFSSDKETTVYIWARKTAIPYEGLSLGRRIHLRASNIVQIKREVDGIDLISAERRLWGNKLVSYQNKSGDFDVFGIADDFFKIRAGAELVAGRTLYELDNAKSRKVVILGAQVVDTLFGKENPIGQYISINQLRFRVVGQFSDEGQNGRNNKRIYLPDSAYQTTFGRGEDIVSGILYTPKEDADHRQVEKDVIAYIKKLHRIAPNDKSAIRSYNVAVQAERFNALFYGIQAFIWFVGLGTLAAGIVGISNIMLITVKERTVEIGIRKALGARPMNIVSSLLFESVLITAIAGYFGLVCGVGLIELVSFSLESLSIENDFFKRPEVDFTIAVQAIIVLIAAGTFAGLIPAWRAAKISPIEAMRSE